MLTYSHQITLSLVLLFIYPTIFSAQRKTACPPLSPTLGSSIIPSSKIKSLKTRSKGNLAREVASLRTHLALHSSGEEELDACERGIALTQRSRSSSFSAPKGLEFENEDLDFKRTLSDTQKTITDTQKEQANIQSRQTHTQDVMSKVLEQSIKYQEQETNYNRRTRRITWIATGATFIYATTGFIMTNWPTISRYFKGGHPGDGGGAGGNSTST